MHANDGSISLAASRRLGRGRLPLAIAVLVSALSAVIVGIGAVVAQQESRILFTGAAGSTSDLFEIAAVGGTARNLTRTTGSSEAQGDWSPDGATVAHATYADGLWRIAVTNVATGAQSKITAGPEDLEPDWSPDGSRLLFTAYFNRGTADQASFLMTVSPTGGPARPIIALADPRYFIGNPHWSPDGSRIAFVVAGPSDGGEIYTAAADGTAARRLLSHPGWDDIDPAWSPTGTHIAFASGRFGGSTDSTRHDIWLLDVELGVAGTVLVDTSLDLRRPTWSPDGRMLAFDARTPSGSYTVRTAPALGGTLGEALAAGAEPDWAGQMPVAPTLPGMPSPTPTATPPASPTPPLTASPPPATEFPPVETLPPFPTMPPTEPTDPGPPPTFPRPTATATPTFGPSASPVATETTEPTPTSSMSVAIHVPYAARRAPIGNGDHPGSR